MTYDYGADQRALARLRADHRVSINVERGYWLCTCGRESHPSRAGARTDAQMRAWSDMHLRAQRKRLYAEEVGA